MKMQRRRFLQTTSLAVATTALPLTLARAAGRGTAEPRFLLARSAVASAGAPFADLDQDPCTECTSRAVRIRLDGMHFAQAGAVLRELTLQAMFDVPREPSRPFIAWHYAAGRPANVSQRASFVAGRASMRGFELAYRLEAGERRQEACALTRFERPLLLPGHYILAGPRRDGSRVQASALSHSGDPAAPLASARDFDYLALRIEALA